jgi:hypothetical protein
MTSATVSRPLIELHDVRVRIWPILLATLLMQGILLAGRELARWLLKPEGLDRGWTFVAAALFGQALFGYASVLVMRRALPEADDHIRWPQGKSYALPAVLIGIGMGVTMLFADYWPDLFAGRAPQANYEIEPVPAIMMLVALSGTGFAEETIFRGLLTGMLVVLVPGRVRVGRLDLPLAAYIVALIFGIAHWESFIHDPLHLAIAQQIYAFIWAVVYTWLMVRSDSLLAPIIAHGVSNAVEVGLVILLIANYGAAGAG